MKTSVRLRIMAIAMILAFVSPLVHAAEYYVVIGAFEQESNAKRFITTVSNFFKHVSYTLDESRQLYYVTAMKTSRKEDARNLALYLKNEKGFADAWVLMKPDSPAGPLSVNASKARGNDAYSVHETSDAESESEATTSSAPSASSTAIAFESAWKIANGLAFIPNVDNLKSFHEQVADPKANLFTFFVEDELGNSLPSEVMLVDFAAIKKLAAINPGEKVAIKSTKREKVVTFVCDKIGYQQETRMFNMDHLSRSKDIRKNEHGVWEVRIKLKPMEVHEIAFMNKTLFYKDAAVLELSSQGELDELVALMKSNPGYKIILHSHCNPGKKREIKVPLEDTNYFDLNATSERNGTDKLLTKKRAEVLRNYLVANGIDNKRIQMVAWGSKEPIVRSTSKDAALNERMEIELVD